MLKIIEKYAKEMSEESFFYSIFTDDLANMSDKERLVAEEVFSDFVPYEKQHELSFSTE